MRRLLFNPLAQQPYASGEYDSLYTRFVIDKPLEYGNLYIVQVYNTDLKEVSTTIMDLTHTGNCAISSLHLSDSTEIAEPFYLYYNKEAPTYINTGSDQAQSLVNNFVIYFYKVF